MSDTIMFAAHKFLVWRAMQSFHVIPTIAAVVAETGLHYTQVYRVLKAVKGRFGQVEPDSSYGSPRTDIRGPVELRMDHHSFPRDVEYAKWN